MASDLSNRDAARSSEAKDRDDGDALSSSMPSRSASLPRAAIKGTVSAPMPLTLAALTKLRRERYMGLSVRGPLRRFNMHRTASAVHHETAIYHYVRMDALRLIVAAAVALAALGALVQLVWGWLDIPSLADVPMSPGWTRRPRVSVIVAARDEERHINAA